MAIERYQDSVGVQPVGPSARELPQILDPLQDANKLARSALNFAEPFAQRRAQDAALEDAGDASLTKDENGNYRLPDPPKGGMVYAKVYSDAVDERFVTSTMMDFQVAANEAHAIYKNKPQEFLVTMKAKAQARLDAAPSHIRGELDKQLSREILERHRGLSDDKARADFTNEVDAATTTIENNDLEAAQLYSLGTPDARRRADELVAKNHASYTALVALGALGPAGAEAHAKQSILKLGDERDYGVSMETIATTAPLLVNATNEELSTMNLWLDGVQSVDPKTTVGGHTFTEWMEHLPSVRGKNLFQSLVRGQMGIRQQAETDRVAALRHAETLAAQQAQVEASNRIVVAVETQNRELNYEPTMGHTREQMAAIGAQYGNIHEQMRQPQGRLQIAGMFNQYGVAPKELTAYIDGSINGDEMMPLLDFITTVRPMNVKGNNAGQLFYEGLSPKTRAMVELADDLAAAGRPAAFIKGQLEQFRSSQTYTTDAAVKIVGSRAGEKLESGAVRGGYEDQRSAEIARVTGAPLGTVRIASRVHRAFDAALPLYLQSNGGDVDKAMNAAARSVAANFQKSNIFLGGFGPKRFFAGFTVGAMQTQMPGRSAVNPTGARVFDLDVNQQPRIRLEPKSNAPLRDLETNQPVIGRLIVHFYDKQGNGTGSQEVDGDELVRRALAVQAQYNRERAPKAKPVVGPRWQLRRGADGKVRYEDTRKGK